MSGTKVIFEAPNGDYLGKLQEWSDKNNGSLSWDVLNIGTQGRPIYQATPLIRAEPRGDCAGTGPSKQEARAAAAKKLWETDRQAN